MKARSTAFCLVSALLIAGCADPLEKPPTQEAAEHFQRGISGQGQLGPLDRSDDPYVKQGAADTHP